MGRFPKLGYHFGVPILRMIVFGGLYWDPPILGNYHIQKAQRVFCIMYFGTQGYHVAAWAFSARFGA